MSESVEAQEDPAPQEDAAGERPLPELEADLLALASDLAAAECRWLQMVEEFDRREGWAGFGVLSCAHWLSWRCGLSLAAAHEKVRVARALRTLPKVVAAFASGELSYARTRAIVKAATPDNEGFLVDLARQTTGAQLEKLVRATVGVQQLDEVAERQAQCYVRSHWADDGSLIFRARLAPEQGAALLRAIDAAQGADWRGRAQLVEGGQEPGTTDVAAAEVAEVTQATAGPVDPAEVVSLVEGSLADEGELTVDEHEHDQPPETREERTLSRVDALVTVAEAYIAGHAPVGGADVYQVVVHVRDDAPAHVEDGPALPVATALRLACDSSVYCVHTEAKGDVLDIGRTTRKIPPALRKALWLRDGGCRFPGCTRTRRVDAHHIQHWLYLGPTALANLLLLCRRHHGSVHEGGFGLRVASDGSPVFTRPDGSLLPEVPTMPESQQAPMRWHRAAVRAAAIDTRWLGDKLDLPAVVDAVLRAKSPRPGAGAGPGARLE